MLMGWAFSQKPTRTAAPFNHSFSHQYCNTSLSSLSTHKNEKSTQPPAKSQAPPTPRIGEARRRGEARKKLAPSHRRGEARKQLTAVAPSLSQPAGEGARRRRSVPAPIQQRSHRHTGSSRS